MLKKSTILEKAEVKVEVKAEKKTFANLNLDLSLLRSLRPCWTAFLSILHAVLLLSQMCRPLIFHPATIVFPQTPSLH